MEIEGLKFMNSDLQDMDNIFSLFDSAIAYQQKHGYDLWPQFSRNMIENEIAEKRHWKIMDGDTIACIFSVQYNDPVIWGEECDKDPSVYLHRTAINPAYKGRGIMRLIKDWAITHARELGKKYVRMDTWGNNISIRNYYIQCGFPYIGQQQLGQVEGLPSHYGGTLLSLFEIEV
jgi:GNAT superfamily N-acetyltransferase